MNTLNNTAVRLDQYGQIDTAFYIRKGNALRSQAISKLFAKLFTQLKQAITPAQIVINNNTKAA